MTGMRDLLITTEAAINSIPVSNIRLMEKMRGFTVFHAGQSDYVPLDEWFPATMISINHSRVRLVLLHARAEGAGILTRTIAKIQKDGLQPVIIAPTDRLIETIKRRNWRSKIIVSPFGREEIWYPRGSST